jgi:hypothetical protein
MASGAGQAEQQHSSNKKAAQHHLSDLQLNDKNGNEEAVKSSSWLSSSYWSSGNVGRVPKSWAHSSSQQV